MTEPVETIETVAAEPETEEATGTRRLFRDLPPVTERELAARARGLASAYIDGGDDPELEATKRREAKYMRLLVGMVALIVGGGLIITIIGLATMGSGQ